MTAIATTGPIWQLLIASQVVSLLPALVAWWVGRHLLQLNPALLMGAVAGARQNTTSMRAAQKASVALSVVGYLVALFA